jgi:hypothetical protein
MIPKDFIHKCMFVYLYNFSNKKVLLYIAILYIFLLFYFSINDGGIVIMFLLMYILLFLKTFDINKTLNKEFRRYRKYLVLKRKRIKI